MVLLTAAAMVDMGQQYAPGHNRGGQGRKHLPQAAYQAEADLRLTSRPYHGGRTLSWGRE
ncbi:hypothetical protein GCM10022245_12910 [Streptomyces mayteni]